MNRPARQRPLIGLLRESTRLAAWVLAFFLASTALTIACAAHDLADAGIGSDVGFTAAANDPGNLPGSDAPSSGHAVGDCCHSGCHHAPAVLTILATVASAEPSHVFLPADNPCPAAPVQRTLRPPIL
jgi:hypothetical protein